jgi:hypothetical protein
LLRDGAIIGPEPSPDLRPDLHRFEQDVVARSLLRSGRKPWQIARRLRQLRCARRLPTPRASCSADAASKRRSHPVCFIQVRRWQCQCLVHALFGCTGRLSQDQGIHREILIPMTRLRSRSRLSRSSLGPRKSAAASHAGVSHRRSQNTRCPLAAFSVVTCEANHTCGRRFGARSVCWPTDFAGACRA